MNHPTSASILERARRVTPGGVNTSIRRVDPMPVWSRAAGSRVYDVQGREYIDYHAAFGPAILGHCHPGVNRRVRETVDEIDLLDNDDRQQVRYRQLLLKEGIFKLPMSLKRSHIGGAHTEEDIDRTLSAAEDAFRRLVHGESRPVALQSVGTESGEPK